MFIIVNIIFISLFVKITLNKKKNYFMTMNVALCGSCGREFLIVSELSNEM